MTWDDQLSDYLLIGIVSNGAPSCFRGHPSVFTEVAAYTNWIQKTIEYHDTYDLENEDSYLFYPYFNSPSFGTKIIIHVCKYFQKQNSVWKTLSTEMQKCRI